MPRPIGEDELEPLALGAWILGTGGGGSPYHHLLNLRQAYRAGKRVELVQAHELADDDLVAVASNMGAPLVGQERLKDPQTAARAVRMMEEYSDIRFSALMSIEIGGGNALQPLVVATELGLPVVDADAMGRAFPELQMTSFAIGELTMYPLALCDVRGHEVIITKASTPHWAERIGRKVCVEMGSIASTCKAPRTGREVRDWAIHGTVSKAIRIGKAVLDARRRFADPVAAVIEEDDGKLLLRGKVVDVDRRTTGGFLRGKVVLDGLDGDLGRRMEIEFQNEFVLATLDGEPVAMAPDLICVLETETGDAIGTEMLRYGQRISVIALPPSALLTSPAALTRVGPRAFGYDLDFRSVFLP
ncbi:MAG: DUF917 domain-containing protein [Rhizobiaceae bacterium]